MPVEAFVCVDLNAVVSPYSTSENALAGFSPTRTCLSSNFAAGDPMETAPCPDQPLWMVRASCRLDRLLRCCCDETSTLPRQSVGDVNPSVCRLST
jgi:hypothetical protein